MHDTDWNMMAATQQNLELHPEMRFIINGQAYRVTNVDNVSIDNVSELKELEKNKIRKRLERKYTGNELERKIKEKLWQKGFFD